MTQQPHEGHCGGRVAAAGAFEKFGEAGKRRLFQRLSFDLAFGQKSAERLAAFQQILRLGTVERRTIKRRIDDLLVADRDVEPRAEFAKLLFVELFLLVRNVAALAGFAQAVAFHRLGEDDRGLTLVFLAKTVKGYGLGEAGRSEEHTSELQSQSNLVCRLL